jgi:hypothetical protein
MFPKNLFTNIFLIALSVGIFFTYLKPTFARIEADQNLIAQYRDELTKVQSVNARLDQLADKAKQLSSEDRDRMYTYLPNEVDTVTVQRDVLLIAKSVGISLTGLSAPDTGEGGEVSTPTEADGGEVERSLLRSYDITVNFAASYDVLKKFLAALEQSHYPLHVSALSISAEAGQTTAGSARSAGDLGVAMTITTYAMEMLESAY